MRELTPVAVSVAELGQEIGVTRHLRDGDEWRLSMSRLLRHGQTLFEAVFTAQEGGGRPLSKGTGDPLTDPSSPLIFPRNFNRLSAMDANSCASCHSVPFLGGGGHFTANAVLIGQRFDFITFDHADTVPVRGALDERGLPIKLQSFNSRATLGMFGSGFIEMLARQITEDLQAIRDALAPGASSALSSKGVDYGSLFHHGLFATMREAILAHAGEAAATTAAFKGLPSYDQASVIEFLKTLQVLPAGAEALIVDEHGHEKQWPPKKHYAASGEARKTVIPRGFPGVRLLNRTYG